MKYTGPLYAKMPGTRKYVKLREDSEYVDNLETKLADARAEIERKNETIDTNSIMLSAREALINKQSKLIEQMREALEDAFDHICLDGDPLDARELEVCNKIEAALEAAERGE